MSTTTPSPRETKPEEGAVASTPGRGLQGWFLILVVFVPGPLALASRVFLLSVIPFLSRPILLLSQSSFATYSLGVFLGSLVSVIRLFAIPMILLGCVSPFAIRLRIEQVGKSGRTSGQLYAISTAGSI